MWMFAFAIQQAPGQQPATDALGTIGQYGAVGAICVLAIVALFLSIRGWLKEKDQRREDLEKMAGGREKDG